MNVYPGPDLMGHTELKVDLSTLPSLIKQDSLKELEHEYLRVSKHIKYNVIDANISVFYFY